MERLQHALGVWQKRLAHLGEADATAVPLEQRLAEVAFQGLDTSGHRRLGKAEVLGGTAEIAVLGDLQIRLDLSQVHEEPSPLSKQSIDTIGEYSTRKLDGRYTRGV